MAERDKKVDLKLSSLSRFGLRGGRGAGRGTAGPSRLPSLKPTRDLTLGGAAPKRTFTPNIVGRSVKKEGDNEADSGKGPNRRHERDRGRGRGRGRGSRGGRGRGRGEIISSTGIFSQGIFPKETLAGALSGGYYSRSASNEDNDDSMDNTGESKSTIIKNVKGEEEEDSEKILELLEDEGKIEIDHDEVKAGGLMPITLPLASKLANKIKTNTEIKSESSAPESDFSQDEAEPVIKPSVKKKKPILKGTNLLPPVEINDIFKPSGMEDGQLFFMQLPDVLPINALAQDVEDDVKMETAGVATKQDQPESDIEEQLKKFSFNNVSEGYIGKLQIHKSGKVKMRLGNVALDLSLGTPCGFLQDLIAINTQNETPDMVCMGHVNHRLIATPDYKALLGSLMN